MSSGLCLDVEFIDQIDWEEPYAEINPCEKHNQERGQCEPLICVNCELEDWYEHIRCIHNKHDASSDGNDVGDVWVPDKHYGHYVMKQVLAEIAPWPMEAQNIDDFKDMVGELDNVEIVQVFGQWLARVVHEVLRISTVSKKISV